MAKMAKVWNAAHGKIMISQSLRTWQLVLLRLLPETHQTRQPQDTLCKHIRQMESKDITYKISEIGSHLINTPLRSQVFFTRQDTHVDVIHRNTQHNSFAIALFPLSVKKNQWLWINNILALFLTKRFVLCPLWIYDPRRIDTLTWSYSGRSSELGAHTRVWQSK